MSGFISIQRSMKDHWLWDDAVKFKWWISILMSCNYSDAKVLIKGTLIECKRGQCIKSLDSWAQDWRTTKKTVHSFFKLLESDKIIETENMRVTTRLTVCNYDVYQKAGNAEGTESKREGNAEETQRKRSLPSSNKDNKVNKENKENIVMPFESENFSLMWENWKSYKVTQHKFKYKTPQSEQATLKELSNLSAGSEQTAIAIIEQSMGKGWKGFFPLKQNSPQSGVQLSRMERAIQSNNSAINILLNGKQQ